MFLGAPNEIDDFTLCWAAAFACGLSYAGVLVFVAYFSAAEIFNLAYAGGLPRWGGLLLQVMHLQASVQGTPSWKHSQ